MYVRIQILLESRQVMMKLRYDTVILLIFFFGTVILLMLSIVFVQIIMIHCDYVKFIFHPNMHKFVRVSIFDTLKKK
jgi:hypothetical protein